MLPDLRHHPSNPEMEGNSPYQAGTREMYSYEALEGSDIRIATLKPGAAADPISISLRHVGPQDEPKYKALSYTWGDPKDECSLQCGGAQLTVTKNLYSALVHLRDERNPRNFWIDAVCIYQDRYRTKCCRNLRFEPQFCEGIGFAHLACRIGKFTHNSAFASPCPFFVSI
jgi:Heterokaryon incompatibility protein (HET)